MIVQKTHWSRHTRTRARAICALCVCVCVRASIQSSSWDDHLSEVIENVACMGARAHTHMYTVRLQGGDDHLAEDIDNLRCVRVSVREISAHLPGAQKPAVEMLLHAGIAGI